MKDSRAIHWEDFELRKSWLDYSTFESFFVLSVCKNRVRYSLGFGSASGPQFLGEAKQYLLNPLWLGVTKRLINLKLQFCCSWNLKTFHRIYPQLISVSFLRFPGFLHFMRSQFVWHHYSWWNRLFVKIRFLIKKEIHMLLSS